MPLEAWVCLVVFFVCVVVLGLPSTVNATIPGLGCLLFGFLAVYFASRPMA